MYSGTNVFYLNYIHFVWVKHKVTMDILGMKCLKREKTLTIFILTTLRFFIFTDVYVTDCQPVESLAPGRYNARHKSRGYSIKVITEVNQANVLLKAP